MFIIGNKTFYVLDDLLDTELVNNITIKVSFLNKSHFQ